MTIIRRIYAYLLAFAGLAMLSLAAAHLLQLLVDLALQAPLTRTDGYVRDSASLYAAAALVGLPVWLVHWLWIGRLVRADPRERASTLRRLYLYAVLAAATLEIAGAARDVLFNAFAALVNLPTPDSALDGSVRPLPFLLVAVVVWRAHWQIAATDRVMVGEAGGSATLRRWYVYGAAFVGLMLLLPGASDVVASLWRMMVHAAGPAGATLPRPAADVLVGLGLWLVHWVLLPARLPVEDRRGDETSLLRSAYAFLALAVGVAGTLSGLSQLLYYAAARLLGVTDPGGVGGSLLEAAAGPSSIAIVYGAAWAYQRSTLRRGPTTVDETPRQAGVRRLYTYLVALVALGVLTSGVAGLLWTLGDVLIATAVNGGGWREQVALYATLAIVGLPAWVLHWRPYASEAHARSRARRLYLYLSLIVAMLALVGSAAAGLYRLLGVALGGGFSVSVEADLVHALAVAAVAAGVAAYHWRVVRADGRLAQHEPPPDAQAAESSSTPSTPSPATATIRMQAADAASLDRALATLRSQPGVDVTVVERAAVST